MRRLHVIETPEHRMGGEIYYREEHFAHDPELHHAYKCGVKQGWREVMEELEHGGYHERHYGRTYPPMMREHDHDWDDDYSDRRGRDAMGRYIRR